MIHAKNEKQLLDILKIVSEEAVKHAKKKVLRESQDPALEMYKKALEYDMNKYGTNLSEQEEAEEETEGEETAKVSEPEEVQKPEHEELDPSEMGKNFDDVVKDINTLRSGKSTKNDEVKKDLIGYFDRLSEDERRVLHLFMKEVGGILKGAIDGDEAQDPSSPPFNMSISSDEREEVKDDAEEKPEVQPKRQSSGAEDTSPPIRVNENQDLTEIRKTFKRLIKRI